MFVLLALFFTSLLECENVKMDCGRSAFPLKERNANRIVGGWEANPHSIPWQVYIEIMNFTDVFVCGGSIIQLQPGNSTKFILTAAHCFIQYYSSRELKTIATDAVSVISGMHNRNEIENSRKLHFVKNIITHNNFSRHFLHDIAIVQLHNPILYSNYSRPICLPEVNSSLPEHNCWISGWGYSNIHEISATLLMTSASLWKGDKDNSFPYYEEYEFFSGSSSRSGHKGDSGGPFFCRNNNIYTLYGVASFRPPFAAPGTLISYVRFVKAEFKCGKPAFPMKEYNGNRIINGWEAYPHSIPWQVFLSMQTSEGDTFCGGTIIQPYLGNSTNFVLTAAHCLQINEPYDISLLKLQSPIFYTKFTRPICLPEANSTVPENDCWSSGWGYTTSTGSSSSVLLMVATPLFKLGKYFPFELFSEYEFLAGSLRGGGFLGDSGGPLFCKVDEIYFLYGIASFFPSFTYPGSIIGYSKVSAFIDWIEETTKM
ncbi:Plasminogen -like protein [Trichinella papuae]|uniref:Acrosin n=1 Tax=Trichinella papuae TaxID=268474 RepID=A0A0V1MQ20_9BILA|nr:Plasminogen -like protein [Trichinella papuae]